jgi:hypothetical protein
VSAATDWSSMPQWKQDLLKPVHKAVYNAAVGTTDAEVRAVVDTALLRARRDLSS